MKKKVKRSKINYNVYIVSGIVVVLVLLVVGLVSLKPESGELVSDIKSEESSGILNSVFNFFNGLFESETKTGYESNIPELPDVLELPNIPEPEWDESYEYIGLDKGDECANDLDCKICLRCDYAPDDPFQEKKVCVPSPSRSEAEHPVNVICDFRVSDSYCSGNSVSVMRKTITSYCDGVGGCTDSVEKESEIGNCMFIEENPLNIPTFSEFPISSKSCYQSGCYNGRCFYDSSELIGEDCRVSEDMKGECVLIHASIVGDGRRNLKYATCMPKAKYSLQVSFINEKRKVDKEKIIKELKKLYDVEMSSFIERKNPAYYSLNVYISTERLSYLQLYLEDIEDYHETLIIRGYTEKNGKTIDVYP